MRKILSLLGVFVMVGCSQASLLKELGFTYTQKGNSYLFKDLTQEEQKIISNMSSANIKDGEGNYVLTAKEFNVVNKVFSNLLKITDDTKENVKKQLWSKVDTNNWSAPPPERPPIDEEKMKALVFG